MKGKRRVLSASLILVMAVAAACSDGDSVQGGQLELDASIRSDSGIDERSRLVIRDEAEWRELWGKISAARSPAPELPQIDFREHVVVVATMGRAPDLQHQILIEDVTLLPGGAQITVVEIKPGQGCGVLPAIGTPIDIYVAPRFTGDPQFVEREASPRC